jgi:N6-L-threonylcarbamoyladenine synthase
MRILGIETSCDETAAAVVVDGRRVDSNVISSQIALHQAHGGVVPELAARGHIAAIMPVVNAALAEANATQGEMDAIAVTAGPGLAGSLLVGVNVAKTLAFALDLPLIPVNHLDGHIYANWLGPAGAVPPEPEFPLLCLLVSGGHTELILMRSHDDRAHLGQTLDDAAGEAFDKGARLLGLGYPGGPAIQKTAQSGDPHAFDLPRAWLGDTDDFSFSGLKTALLRLVEPYRIEAKQNVVVSGSPFVEHVPPVYSPDAPIADLAAAYQEAIVDVLATKAVRAAVRDGAKTLALAGGVAASKALRARIEADLAATGEEIAFRAPPMSLCTDNAAMIAGAAFHRAALHGDDRWNVDVHPRLPLFA